MQQFVPLRHSLNQAPVPSEARPREESVNTSYFRNPFLNPLFAGGLGAGAGAGAGASDASARA